MRERRVLVDTAAWLGVFHRRDQYHAEAAAELRRLRLQRVPLVVTNLILAEVHVHLLYGVGAARAADHLVTLKSDPFIEEVFADRALQDAAMREWIGRYRNQSFTLTDAISFAVMRREGIQRAFTFDQHFMVAGFETIPRVPPADL